MNRRGFIGRVLGGALALLGISQTKAAEPVEKWGQPELPTWFRWTRYTENYYTPDWKGVRKAEFDFFGTTKSRITGKDLDEWRSKELLRRRRVKMGHNLFLVFPKVCQIEQGIFDNSIRILWSAELWPCEG